MKEMIVSKKKSEKWAACCLLDVNWWLGFLLLGYRCLVVCNAINNHPMGLCITSVRKVESYHLHYQIMRNDA